MNSPIRRCRSQPTALLLNTLLQNWRPEGEEGALRRVGPDMARNVERSVQEGPGGAEKK